MDKVKRCDLVTCPPCMQILYETLITVFPLRRRPAGRPTDSVPLLRHGRQIGFFAPGADTLGFGGFCTVDDKEKIYMFILLHKIGY